MSCECPKVCTMPKCSESIIIGTIAPDTTVLVQFQNIITGKIKQVQSESDEDGLLTADISLINSFFTENFAYEITLLSSNKNQCDISEWLIGEESVSCVTAYFNMVEQETPATAELSLVA